MKGQSTLEFMGSLVLFVVAVIAVLSIATDEIPAFYDSAEISEKNLEARHMTEYMLTSEESGPEIAEGYMELGLENLEEDIGAGPDYYNYTDLREDLGLSHTYNIQFTRFPIVETHQTFIRGDPPKDDPLIFEPDADEYQVADNRVHYGKLYFDGSYSAFLVTAVDGEYNGVYHHAEDQQNFWYDWNEEPKREGDHIITATGRNMTIEAIQNRDSRPGAMIVLREEIEHGDGREYFGVDDEAAEGEVEKINRYPMVEDPLGSTEPVRMEVLVW